MNKKRYISASEIGAYTFCRRAWVLKILDYESDNQYELEEGNKYHEEAGKDEISRSKEEKPHQTQLSRQAQVLSIFIFLLILCMIAIIVRLVLK